jgi:hypothetical protein
LWVLSFKNWGVKSMEGGVDSGWIGFSVQELQKAHTNNTAKSPLVSRSLPPPKKRRVFVWLIPLGVEQS